MVVISVEEVAEETEESSSFKMELQNISIERARIIYDDATLPMHMDINQLNLGISGNLTEALTIIDSKGSIETFNLTFDAIWEFEPLLVVFVSLDCALNFVS